MSKRNFAKILNGPRGSLATMNAPISVKVGYAALGEGDCATLVPTHDDERPDCRRIKKKRRRIETLR